MINANSFLFAFYVKSINIYYDYYLYANYGMGMYKWNVWHFIAASRQPVFGKET